MNVKTRSVRILPGIQRLEVRNQVVLLALLLGGCTALVALLDAPLHRYLVTLPALLAIVILTRQINLGLRVPLGRLTQVAGRWYEGDLSARANLRPQGELGQLAALLNGVVERLRQNLAERDAAEQALRASESRFRTLTELSSDWYWEQDAQFRFTFLAGSSSDPVSISRANRIGRTRWEMPDLEASEEDWRAHKAQLESRKPFYDFEVRRLDGNGQSRWISISGAPVFDDSGFAGYRGVGRDITARKLGEQELRAANAALEERVAARTADLVAANRELEAFAYTVSHDLRAPLRYIGGHAGMLREELGSAASARATELLTGIVDGAQRLAELIDRLLEFARLSRQPLQRTSVDLNALVGELLATVASDAGRCEVVVGELPSVQADPVLLRQAVGNLVSNAIKFSSRRRKPRIEIGCEHEDGKRVFYVRDNGVGFPMRYADKVFEVFQRLHTESHFPGVGAGLAVVKRIVERHGGRIWADARVGKGAVFRFTLDPSPPSAA